jgi:sortase (surface protein transpeptidase)
MRRPALLVCLTLAAAGCGAEEQPALDAQPRTTTNATSAATPDGGDRPRVEREAPAPKLLRAPSIELDAPVIALGKNSDGTLEVPEDYDETGWWTGGPEPGEPGPAVIVGHVDSRAGAAVFARLGELAPGEHVEVVRKDGSSVRYVVRRTERHPKDAFPTERVYGSTKQSTLRLITCSGEFDGGTGHYVDNTIVFADRA